MSMGANASNALFYLVTTIFNLLLWVWMLRVILQAVRADFYNPVSQVIWRITRYPTDPLRRVLPPWRNLNVAAALVLLVLAIAYIYAAAALLGGRLSFVDVLAQAVFKLMVLAVNLYTFSVFVQAILSWLGPGVNNPASNILWSMNEPLLRPVRRFVPPLAGLDLSPLIVILVLQLLDRLIPLNGAFR
jgi:YggT family protein